MHLHQSFNHGDEKKKRIMSKQGQPLFHHRITGTGSPSRTGFNPTPNLHLVIIIKQQINWSEVRVRVDYIMIQTVLPHPSLQLQLHPTPLSATHSHRHTHTL